MTDKFNYIRKDFFSNVGGTPMIGGARPGTGYQAPVPPSALELADKKVAEKRAALNAALLLVASRQKKYNECNAKGSCRRNYLEGYAQKLQWAKNAVPSFNEALNEAIKERAILANVAPVYNDLTPRLLYPNGVPPITPTSTIPSGSSSTTTSPSAPTKNELSQKGLAGMSTTKKVVIGSVVLVGIATTVFLAVRTVK